LLDKVEEGSMKNLKKILWLVTIGVIIVIGLASCSSTDWAMVADSLNTANNQFATSYANTSETGMTFTINNRSSEWVTVWDDTGEKDIRPGGSISARFNKYASISDVYYTPGYLRVSQSGFIVK
jgi:hypothetical protein